VQEQQVMITDLKTKRAESDRQRLLLLEKNAGVAPPSPHHSREDRREEELELIQLRQVKEILEKELSSLKKSLRSQKEISSEQLTEIKRLHEEVGVLKKQKDLFHMDLVKQQSSRTEYQLNELRKDISETTLNWEITEQHNQKFQELTEKYQELIRREQDKVVLLETQNRLLEERMEMMNQELNIFRSLDIYEATVSTEMKRYHESKSPLTLRRGEREAAVQAGQREVKKSATTILSSDDDEDDYHGRARSRTSVRPLSSPTHAPNSTDRKASQPRASQTLRAKGARSPVTPLVSWRSEMKGEDPQQIKDEEDEVGPGLAMQDMTPSPAYNFRRPVPPQDSKQLTPSLSKLTEERGVHSLSTFSSRTQAPRERQNEDPLSLRQPPSSARLGLGNRREQEMGAGRVSVSAFASRSLGHDIVAAPPPSRAFGQDPTDRAQIGASSRPSSRVGGLASSGRPSKDEFERAKRLLSKR
jgi:hypothetical protein